jgi:hypothetical protein
MGVVHMLVVALVGITYGWQSDNNGGVEYIVQVSPTELKEIDRLGEITSSIDPKVVGHVSRIKIRVGTGTLPRETPADLSARNSHSNHPGIETASDRIAVPIPQMREQDMAAPIRSLDDRNVALIANGAGQAKASMMKPDPDNAGPGFQFPSSVGNAASNTTEGVRTDLDRAGREIADRGQNMLQDLRDTASDTMRNSFGAPSGAARVPAPGTRQPDPLRQPTIPQFTNGRSATTLPGGPTTDPTKARDQGWTDFARPRAGGPTTDAVGADRTRLANPRLNQPVLNDPRGGDSRTGLGWNTASTSGVSSNRTSSGTFGQAPGGMTFPARNTTTDPRMSIDRNSQRNNSANQFTRDRVTSQQQQMELDRQNRTVPSGEFATGSPLRDRPQEPFLRNTVGPQNAQLGDQPIARSQPGNDAGQRPDRRLTNAELDAGAWSIDRYGRLLDRTGRLVTPVAQNDQGRDSRVNLDNRYGNGQPQATLEQPVMNRSPPNLVSDNLPYEPRDLRGTREIPYQQPGIRPPSNTTDFARNPADRARIALEPNPSRDQVRDPVSLTKRDASLTVSPATNPLAKTAQNHIAAQPLFNGLLLMSFVANIYLMFWLKNLRLRFRDLVAAKRLTGTSNQAG